MAMGIRVSGLVFLLGLVVSCSKKETNTARVELQFNNSILGSSKVMMQSASDDELPDWGLADPTSLSEIHCYGIFIKGDEPEMKHSRCQTASSGQIEFGPRAGFFSISKRGSMEVLSGTNRTIYLVGMSSGDGTCATGFATNSEIDDSNFSNPFVIGKTTVDLTKGINVVEVNLEDSFEDDNKILDCDFLNRGEDGTSSLQVSEGSTYDFGSNITSGQYSMIFTLENNGRRAARNITPTIIDTSTGSLSNEFSFAGASGYPGVNGNCGARLDPGETCQFEIQYTPFVNLQLDSATIDFQFYNGIRSDNFSFALMGTGQAPASLTITSPTQPFDFGWVTTGNTVTQTFQLTNNGSVDATSMTHISLSPPFQYTGGSFPGTGGTCVAHLAPGSICQIDVEFSPTTNISFTNNITLNYFDGVNNQTFTYSLQGTGN